MSAFAESQQAWLNDNGGSQQGLASLQLSPPSISKSSSRPASPAFATAHSAPRPASPAIPSFKARPASPSPNQIRSFNSAPRPASPAIPSFSPKPNRSESPARGGSGRGPSPPVTPSHSHPHHRSSTPPRRGPSPHRGRGPSPHRGPRSPSRSPRRPRSSSRARSPSPRRHLDVPLAPLPSRAGSYYSPGGYYVPAPGVAAAPEWPSSPGFYQETQSSRGGMYYIKPRIHRSVRISHPRFSGRPLSPRGGRRGYYDMPGGGGRGPPRVPGRPRAPRDMRERGRPRSPGPQRASDPTGRFSFKPVHKPPTPWDAPRNSRPSSAPSKPPRSSKTRRNSNGSTISTASSASFTTSSSISSGASRPGGSLPAKRISLTSRTSQRSSHSSLDLPLTPSGLQTIGSDDALAPRTPSDKEGTTKSGVNAKGKPLRIPLTPVGKKAVGAKAGAKAAGAKAAGAKAAGAKGASAGSTSSPKSLSSPKSSTSPKSLSTPKSTKSDSDITAVKDQNGPPQLARLSLGHPRTPKFSDSLTTSSTPKASSTPTAAAGGVTRGGPMQTKKVAGPKRTGLGIPGLVCISTATMSDISSTMPSSLASRRNAAAARSAASSAAAAALAASRNSRAAAAAAIRTMNASNAHSARLAALKRRSGGSFAAADQDVLFPDGEQQEVDSDLSPASAAARDGIGASFDDSPNGPTAVPTLGRSRGSASSLHSEFSEIMPYDAPQGSNGPQLGYNGFTLKSNPTFDSSFTGAAMRPPIVPAATRTQESQVSASGGSQSSVVWGTRRIKSVSKQEQMAMESLAKNGYEPVRSGWGRLVWDKHAVVRRVSSFAENSVLGIEASMTYGGSRRPPLPPIPAGGNAVAENVAEGVVGWQESDEIEEMAGEAAQVLIGREGVAGPAPVVYTFGGETTGSRRPRSLTSRAPVSLSRCFIPVADEGA